MWSKTTLKIKITILTAVSLTAMCACLTAISILNANVFYEPIMYIADMQPVNIGMSGQSGIPTISGYDEIKIIDEIYLGSSSKFITQSIVSSLIIVIIGTALSYFIAGKTLQPLKNLAKKIEDIDENNLSGRIELTPNGDEAARLAKSFNNMLEKLDRAFENKKLFAANAAHELKTPLTNMLTSIEVLQMEESPDLSEYEEAVGVTKANIERLIALVQDLLYFNSDANDELYEVINTNRLFEKIVSDLSGSIIEKNITIINTGDTEIYGEHSLLERAFFNVVQNAVKYNKENGTVKITTADSYIEIEDTGIGIREENLPLIFDPFYCVDKSRSRKLGGNGLGLSIAKQIFDKHDIKVTVSSNYGEGTRVMLKLL